MTRALEVRWFWGDALLDVQHHVLREGMKVMGSALLDDATTTLATQESGALALAGERHGRLNVLEHGALSIVMGVVELAPLDRGPREEQPLASAVLVAMALHVSLLAAGMASPQSDALSIDGLRRPSVVAPQRFATVLAAGTNVSASAPGLPEATVARAPGGETARSTRRGGSRDVAHLVRANLLAVLGGVAMRFGSGMGGYDASSVVGAPMPNLVPSDDGLSMGHGARGATCAPPPHGCNASIAYGGHGSAGFRIAAAAAPEPAAGFGGRCEDGRGRCDVVPRIRSCSASCADTRGTLSREAVRRAIRARHNEITFCYERALQRRTDLSGRVSTSFVIDPSGAVVQASASGEDMPDVARCVAATIERIRFPASDGTTGVTYPFDFTSSE